jgi:hypothetical protein
MHNIGIVSIKPAYHPVLTTNPLYNTRAFTKKESDSIKPLNVIFLFCVSIVIYLNDGCPAMPAKGSGHRLYVYRSDVWVKDNVCLGQIYQHE